MDNAELIQKLIELQTINNNLLAQNNAYLLFIIGSASAILVLIVLYKAIKKFI